MDVSNILLTTDNIVYLTDFAPYKPIFMEEADFDKVKLLYPHILERCYLPPEMFDKGLRELNPEIPNLSDMDTDYLEITQKMDIFSVGCILSQIYTDGKAIMDYKDLLSFKDGTFNPYEKIDSMIKDENLASTIKKMMALNPDERGTIKCHLEYFENFFGLDFFRILMAINYALRRSEFSHPDIKLGLIRLLSGYISKISVDLIDNEECRSICKNLEFKSYFPYQISMVVILYSFKAIYQNSPLLRIMKCEGLVEFLDAEIERIEKVEQKVMNSQTSTVLEKIDTLKYTNFNYNVERKEVDTNEGGIEVDIDFEPEAIIKRKLDQAQERKTWQSENFKLNSFHLLLDTILSCTRNLQIDQSFRVAIEMISEYSKLIWDEQILEFVIPFVSNFVIKNKRSSEAILSMRLFCQLIQRMRYIPKSLSNMSVFSVYIKPLRDYCFNSSHEMLRMLVVKNLSIFVELSLLFEVLNKGRIIQNKFKEIRLVGDTGFDSAKLTTDIIEYFQIKDSPGIFSVKNEIGDILMKLADNGKMLTNFSRNFKCIEGYLKVADIKNVLMHVCDILGDTSQDSTKILCLRAIPALTRRLDKRHITRLNRLVLEVLELSANPSTIYECLLNLISFVESFKEDKILSARVIQKTVVLVLHPCLRVRKTECRLVEIIMSNSTQEEILTYYAPIIKSYTKNVRKTQ